MNDKAEDPQSEPQVQHAVQLPVAKGLQFQDIDDWMKAQEELDNQRKATQKSQPSSPQAKKKMKSIIDIPGLTAEQQALSELGETNWIGKLLEYRQANPLPGPSLEWKESTHIETGIPRFSYTITINESPSHFTTLPTTFGNKKKARQYAAKKVIDYLIQNNHMPSDGSVRFPKVVQPPPEPTRRKSFSPNANQPGSLSPSFPTNSDSEPEPTSYTTQIPTLCYKLGFTSLQYVLTPEAPGAPFWDCHAHFGGDPRIDGVVGKVERVYGKKNAKRECAKGVWKFLKDIERQRGEAIESVKRKRASGSSEMEGTVGKAVKVEGGEISEGRVARDIGEVSVGLGSREKS